MNTQQNKSNIGKWSEVKLTIVEKYAEAYSKILKRQPRFSHYYIDGFCGGGTHTSRERGDEVLGSPARVLGIQPAFKRYYFIDLDKRNTDSLKAFCKKDHPEKEIHIYNDDSNQVLMNKILSNISYREYERVLCLLDPYGMHYEWTVVEKMGKSTIVDLFLNFPIMDINRNIRRKKLEDIDDSQKSQMDKFWGSNDWQNVVYSQDPQLSLLPTAGDNEKNSA